MMVSSSGGSNNMGRITVSHRGGSGNSSYISIDSNSVGMFESLDVIYSSFASAYVGSVCNLGLIGWTGVQYFVEGFKLGEVSVVSSESMDVLWSVGDSILLNYVMIGAYVSNVELVSHDGGRMWSSAGVGGLVLGSLGESIGVRSMSGNSVLNLSSDVLVSLGIVSNVNSILCKLSSAGESSHLGMSPVVSGEAMNAVDHPHGGRTRGGSHPKTAWGNLANFKNMDRSNMIVSNCIKGYISENSSYFFV